MNNNKARVILQLVKNNKTKRIKNSFENLIDQN